MSSWKKAGFSFNKYLAISAETLRSVLKQDLKAEATRRGLTEARATKYSGGFPAETKPLSLSK
ncbi:F1F0 ATP synthase subunit epsilon ASCRUDRAFT_77368 [Ascoidea rubescens DSM 1968]|uniref:Uncharacterized protein n=1 Tax=Ascoidea rubescens DSM 1968 TaxID=1344418 RepID=A0A1D2VBD0_9ASCO|nr:hypothetical protein ASCRUDRAFT_77368 [Ascoidea rubescens DSM 1968]ODV58926.1 hypothetical protein ASCRUDRAFT_77368 [Ascoidea rubescens DSM 1968]